MIMNVIIGAARLINHRLEDSCDDIASSSFLIVSVSPIAELNSYIHLKTHYSSKNAKNSNINQQMQSEKFQLKLALMRTVVTIKREEYAN